MAIEITPTMEQAAKDAKGIVEKAGHSFPDNPTPSNVATVAVFVQAFIRGMLGCVTDKVLKGRAVKAIDAHAGSKVTELMFGKSNAWTVGQVADMLTAALGDKVAVYRQTRLKWKKGDGCFIPQFVEAWNASGGIAVDENGEERTDDDGNPIYNLADPTECCNIIGKDDWGEEILSPTACEFRYEMYKDDPTVTLQPIDPSKKLGGSGRGRKAIALSDDDKAVIGNMVADFLKGLTTTDNEKSAS